MNLYLTHFLGSPPHSSYSNAILSLSESIKFFSRKSWAEINWSFAFDFNRAKIFPCSFDNTHKKTDCNLKSWILDPISANHTYLLK